MTKKIKKIEKMNILSEECCEKGLIKIQEFIIPTIVSPTSYYRCEEQNLATIRRTPFSRQKHQSLRERRNKVSINPNTTTDHGRKFDSIKLCEEPQKAMRKSSSLIDLKLLCKKLTNRNSANNTGIIN